MDTQRFVRGHPVRRKVTTYNPLAAGIDSIGHHDLVARHSGIHSVLDVRGGDRPVLV